MENRKFEPMWAEDVLHILLIIVIGLVGIGLMGCGGTGDSSAAKAFDGAPAEPGTPSTPVTGLSPGPIKVTIRNKLIGQIRLVAVGPIGSADIDSSMTCVVTSNQEIDCTEIPVAELDCYGIGPQYCIKL